MELFYQYVMNANRMVRYWLLMLLGFVIIIVPTLASTHKFQLGMVQIVNFRFTIYTSPADKAIGVAGKLFQSPRGRVGTFGPEDMTETIQSAMEYGVPNFAIINFSGALDAYGSQGDTYGHSYFRNSPTVSSDLVLMLLDDLDPGTPGRPLEHIDLKFWRIPPGYPGKQTR